MLIFGLRSTSMNPFYVKRLSILEKQVLNRFPSSTGSYQISAITMDRCVTQKRIVICLMMTKSKDSTRIDEGLPSQIYMRK